MMKRILVAIGIVALALSFTLSLDAAEKGKGKGKKERKGIKEMSQKELVKLALSAAPVHISKDATVMVPGADGKMVEAKIRNQRLYLYSRCRWNAGARPHLLR